MTPEHWNSYVFNLLDLSSGAAKRRFKQAIKDAWSCCAYCGESEMVTLTVDHVKPRAHGGETLRSNLVAACDSCQRDKGSERDFRAWFKRKPFFTPERLARIEAWTSTDIGDPQFIGSLGIEHGRGSDTGARVPAEVGSPGCNGDGQGGTNPRPPVLLGGTIQAETSFSFDLQIRWVRVQVGRGRYVYT